MKKEVIAKELVKIAKNLVALEFDTKEQMEKYKKEHKVRKDTKLIVKPQKKKKKKKEVKKETPSLERSFKSDDFGIDKEFAKFYGIKDDEAFDESIYEEGDGLGGSGILQWCSETGSLVEPETDPAENLRINRDGKPSFTYNAGWTGWHIYGDEAADTVYDAFEDSDEYKKFMSENPGVEFRDTEGEEEFSDAEGNDYEIFDLGIDQDVNRTEKHRVCFNEDGSLNVDASRKLNDIFNDFASNIKVVNIDEINKKPINYMINLNSKIEVNCDDLYRDLPVHKSKSGANYINLKDAKSSKKSKGFDINKLSPELREKLKDMDEEEIGAFIGWLKNRKNGGGVSTEEE